MLRTTTTTFALIALTACGTTPQSSTVVMDKDVTAQWQLMPEISQELQAEIDAVKNSCLGTYRTTPNGFIGVYDAADLDTVARSGQELAYAALRETGDIHLSYVEYSEVIDLNRRCRDSGIALYVLPEPVDFQ